MNLPLAKRSTTDNTFSYGHRFCFCRGRGVSLHNPVGVLVDACAEIKCQEKYSTAKHLFARYAHMPQPFTNYVHDFRGILDR